MFPGHDAITTPLVSLASFGISIIQIPKPVALMRGLYPKPFNFAMLVPYQPASKQR